MTESDATRPLTPAPDPAAAPAPTVRPDGAASGPEPAAPGPGTDSDPPPIADGVMRQLDPNTIRVERIASWIFTALVGVGLLIQLIVNLFGGPWRIALGLSLTIGVGGFFAWLLWLFVHILFLIGFRNRVVVIAQWAYIYLRNERGARLITGEIDSLLDRA